MRTEDRCLTGVTTSSAPPDSLAPVLSSLNQSEASVWSPDLLSQSQASAASLSHGRIYQDYVLWRPGGNILTSWQCWTSGSALSIENRKQKTLRNKYKNREYWFQTDRPSTLLWCKEGWKNVSKFSSYRFLLIWNHENCWASVQFRDPILWSTFPIRSVFSSGPKTITILSKIIEGVLTMKTLAWRPACWDDFISINFSPMIG